MSFSLPMIKTPLGLPHVLILVILLFGLGLYGLLNARNRLRFLLASQLMLGTVAIALAAFSNHIGPGSFGGQALAMLLVLVGMAWLLVAHKLEGAEE